MKSITEKIREGQVLLSDGAWGTFLQQKGLKPGECPELWNINRSTDVFDIAKSYIDVGADMIETNSFGGSIFKLKQYGLADKVYEINKAAAQISREAAGSDKFVLGSVGPTGKILMMGDVTEEELYNAFKDQCIALAKGGADAIILETMTDLDEAVIAVKAAKENTNCEVICTMTFERTLDGDYKSMMGIGPEDAIEKLIEAGASILGANCGNGMEGMIHITEKIRKANKDIPVLIHANAGLPIYRDGETVFPETPEQMGDLTLRLIKSGANIIGGCCGTTPQHIKKMKEVINNEFLIKSH